MAAESYSFSPQFATIRSESPLAGMRPVASIQHTALSFKADEPFKIRSSGEELVGLGAIEGVNKGVGAALEGITTAYVKKREREEKKDDEALKYLRDFHLAKIKATPTEEEKLIKQARLSLLGQQVQAATAKNEDLKEKEDTDAVESGEINWSDFYRPNFNKKPEEIPDDNTSVTEKAAPSTDVSSATQSKKQKTEGALAGLSNPPVITPIPTQETIGKAVVGGETLKTAPVSGAEGIPIRKAIPIEGPLPEAAPSETLIAEPIQETEEEYRYRAESSLTGRPFKSAADARMAKKILEQQLGVKATVDIEKGEKGTRLHYVRITEDEPSPMGKIPKGMAMKQVTDKDGTVTTIYVPAVPVKQQLATFDNNIEKAKVLQDTITKIKEIAPGYLGAGAGGISGLMQYNPFSNDARTVRKLVDTIKGIVGFDELVALKAAGGSLGALSDSELSMLTSLKGSVDPDLDEATFLANLTNIEKSTKKLIEGLEADKKQLINVENQQKFQPIQENAPILIKSQEEWSKLKSGQRYNFNGDLGTKK